MEQQLEKLFDPRVWKISYARDNATALELATAEAFDLIVTSARTTGANGAAPYAADHPHRKEGERGRAERTEVPRVQFF